MTFRLPTWYAALGRAARSVLRASRSARTGPWTASETDSVWIHAASLGEAKGALSLLRLLPGHVSLTLTATTRAGRDRLRATGHEAFLLPCDDRRSAQEFLAARRVRKALFLEAEAWPATLETLSRAGIPTAFAAFRSSPPSMRRWRLFSKAFPGWTESIEAVWTDRPENVEAAQALGFARVRPGGSLKWIGTPFPEPSGKGFDAAVSLHLRDLPALASLVRGQRNPAWLWFPRRPWQAPVFRAWARLLRLSPIATADPGPGQVYVSPRLGEVAGLLPNCRSAWVSPGHDTEEPFRLGVARVGTGRPPREIPRPDAQEDSVAAEIADWLSETP